MFLGSAKEAASYGANVFMVYTGAPQNTRRKEIRELNIDAGWEYMREHGIEEVVVHAPYIINLGNTVKPETFSLAVEFLGLELERSAAMHATTLVLHPGAHVGAGEEAGIARICEGLNEVLTADTPVTVALETMAGKGSEIGKTFEELAAIYDGVVHNEKLRVCFDTCHVNDAGYDIIHDLDGVLEQFDRVLGRDQIACFHINDSKNERNARKDRHANFGFGEIGFDTLMNIIYREEFARVPKILETPYVALPGESKRTLPPYRYEIAMIRSGQFDGALIDKIVKGE